MEISRDSISPWKCPACLQQFKLDYSLDVDTLLSLPFAAVSDESLLDLYNLQGNNHGETSDEEEECRQRGSHLLNRARKLEARSRKDLRVAHLNVCSLRNKIEELKCLQLICKFDILAITETHLDTQGQWGFCGKFCQGDSSPPTARYASPSGDKNPPDKICHRTPHCPCV